MIFKRLRKSTPEEEREFAERMSDEQVTRKDKFAMVFSAFLVIVVPCILVLLAFAALILLALGAFS